MTKKQKKLLLISILSGGLAGIAVFACFIFQKGHDLRLLERGEVAYQEEVYVTDGIHKEKIVIQVEPEVYTDREKLELLESAAAGLANDILGENQSLDQVEYSLHLMEEIEGTGILVSWQTDQPMILDWEGNIGENVPKDGTWVHLRAELVLEEYIRQVELDIRVFPAKRTESEQFIDELQSKLEVQNQKQGKYLHLPLTLHGKQLIWSGTNGYNGILVFVFAVVIGILLVMREKSREDQIKKKRQMEMQMDYPGILNKLILLMQAGISSRGAFQKIALDYRRERDAGGKIRAAYEEILLAYRDMEQGVSEEQVYRDLGNRCGLLCYRTFTTLLVQNLKKGSNYFISALKQECHSAFEMRKHQALIRGEEAGTKLLLPMGCMLLIVLLIILVPSMMALG